MRKLLFACAVLFGQVYAASAQMPVYEKLYVRDSAHFRYIYTQSAAPLIPRIARACDDARFLLSPFFKHQIADRMIVLVADDIDIHNGWATTIPSPRMQIYLAATPPFSTIYEPGDELRRTIFHEYAHALTMDAIHGVRGSMAAVFGRVMPVGDPLSMVMTYLTMPAAVFAPVWYLEGLAIFAETEFAGAGPTDEHRNIYGPGRGRNTMADMILRMAVYDNRQLPPHAWDLNLPEWPESQAAYLYGMRVIQYVQETAGLDQDRADATGSLADAVNHSWPFLFDHRAIAVTGKTFDQLARAAATRERESQRERLDLLRRTPFTPLERLTPARLQVESPVFGGNGESVYFVAQGEAGRGAIYRYDPADATLRHYPAARVMPGTGVRLYPAPDRRSLYYSRLEFTGRDRLWKQLYRFDTETGREHRLTSDGRYQYPAVSPDGETLAAVRVEGGLHSLLEVPLRQAGRRSAERVLYAPEYGHHLLEPVYLPGGELVYVEADENGSRIRRVNRGDGNDEVLLDWPCVIAALRPAADGRHLLFSADRTGVYNLYRMPVDGSGTPVALTHVPGGVLGVAPSPADGQLFVVNYDSYGFHLAALRVDDDATAVMHDNLPALEPVWRADPVNMGSVAEAIARPAAELSASRPYRGWRNAEFDFWSPWMTWSDDGARAGLVLSFSEPAGYHALRALGGYDTDAETVIGSVNYQYAGWYPLWNFYGDREVQMYPELLRLPGDRRTDYYETASQAGVSVTIPLPRTRRQLEFLAGYNWTHREGIDRKNPEIVSQEDATPVFEGGESVFFAGLNWFDGTAFNRSHSVEDGRLVRVMADYAGLGGDLTRQRATGQWCEYVTLPWSENQVFKLEGLYGAGRGDNFAQGAFGLGGFYDEQGYTPGVARNITLRGYPRNYQTGTDAARVTAAWRFPLWRSYRAFSSTMPVYRHQLFGELFYDGGRAWGGDDLTGQDNEWIQSAGLELNYALTLLRFVDVAPGIGVAYAFDRERRRDEEDDEVKLQIYLSIKGVVNF